MEVWFCLCYRLLCKTLEDVGYIHERGAASGLGASTMLSVVQHTRMDGVKWIIDITDKNNYIRLLNNLILMHLVFRCFCAVSLMLRCVAAALGTAGASDAAKQLASSA